MLEEELSQRLGAESPLTGSGSSQDSLTLALKEGLSLEEDPAHHHHPPYPADPAHLSTPQLLQCLRRVQRDAYTILTMVGANNDKLLAPEVSTAAAPVAEQSAACAHGSVPPHGYS